MPMVEALVALGALTFVTLGNEIFFTYATQGLGYGFASNRPAVSFSPLAKRVARVYANQVEASSYMVPILAAAAFVGLASPVAETAALVLVAGRVWFVVFYYIGLPFVRIIGFLGGSVGTLILIALLVQSFLKGSAI